MQKSVLDLLSEIKAVGSPGRMVIEWACDTLVLADTPLAENAIVATIAALYANDPDDQREAVMLLDQLVDETVDFTISEEELASCAAKAQDLLRSPEAVAIKRAECATFLLAMCPGVASLYEEARSTQRELEPGLYFGIMGALVSYASELIATNCAAELAQVAVAVEFLIARGDSEVREATIAGFLEGIGNRCSHDPASLPIARLSHLLGPLGKQAMSDLDRFWTGKH